MRTDIHQSCWSVTEAYYNKWRAGALTPDSTTKNDLNQAAEKLGPLQSLLQADMSWCCTCSSLLETA
ncbi:hypothetical protein AV530_005132 [Patagioenas fasciata monilis]|uniref:Uncharacterized protein n=1 Tax=Patagioenas fasciata monilis TaxID=372326 RepID=A0A1V4K5W2_PATFA|nr:hypothetical protein AV530_005132 [Patagioenas fasciata monilis]